MIYHRSLWERIYDFWLTHRSEIELFICVPIIYILFILLCVTAHDDYLSDIQSVNVFNSRMEVFYDTWR